MSELKALLPFLAYQDSISDEEMLRSNFIKFRNQQSASGKNYQDWHPVGKNKMGRVEEA